MNFLMDSGLIWKWGSVVIFRQIQGKDYTWFRVEYVVFIGDEKLPNYIGVNKPL